MATYFMFGKYSAHAMREITSGRTQESVKSVERFGGSVKAIYALLGEHDLVMIVDLPDTEHALKASVALGKLTGISFSTARAVPIEEFDRMIEDV